MSSPFRVLENLEAALIDAPRPPVLDTSRLTPELRQWLADYTTWYVSERNAVLREFDARQVEIAARLAALSNVDHQLVVEMVARPEMVAKFAEHVDGRAVAEQQADDNKRHLLGAISLHTRSLMGGRG